MNRAAQRDGAVVEADLDVHGMLDAPPDRGTDCRLDVLLRLGGRNDETVLDAAHADQLTHRILGRLLLKPERDRSLERDPPTSNRGVDPRRYCRCPGE